MATINSYAALKEAVRVWANRTDNATLTAIPMCIGFAEQDFQRTFRLPEMESRMSYAVDAVTVPTPGHIPLPKDYYEAKHLLINGKTYDRFSYMVMNEIGNNKVPSTVNTPLNTMMFGLAQKDENRFSRVGNDLVVSPTTNIGDVIELIYYKDLEPMELNTDYPPSLQVAPDVMLYLSLRHLALFLRDNDMAQYWEQKAEQAGQRLATRLDEIEWSGSPIMANNIIQTA